MPSASLITDRDPTDPPGEESLFSDDGVDLTLIRWMLSLTPTDRLAAAQDLIDTVQLLRGGEDT